MTSAPRSARIMPQVGPITMWVNSTMRMPASGSAVGGLGAPDSRSPVVCASALTGGRSTANAAFQPRGGAAVGTGAPFAPGVFEFHALDLVDRTFVGAAGLARLRTRQAFHQPQVAVGQAERTFGPLVDD